MAVYHYVAGRDDLLDGVAGVLTRDIAGVTLPAGSTDWRAYLQVTAAGFRELLNAHPAAVPLLLTHPTSTEWWLRAPLNDPAWHQQFLTTLHHCGFDTVASQTAYRWFTSFLTGQLLLDSVSLAAHPLDDDAQAAFRRSSESQSDFEFSLAALTSRLAPLARLAPNNPTGTERSTPTWENDLTL